MAQRIFTVIITAALAVTAATSALAQQADQQPQAGPLVVEKIQNGWLFSPDVRATDLDGRARALAGGYLGRIADNAWVIGAGAYFLTNRDDDFKLAYGGPVFEWLARTDRKIGFGIRALVGAGSATLPRPIADLIDERALVSPHRRRGGQRIPDAAGTVAIRDDFFVAEPQLNVLLNLARSRRIVFGLGYRAVGNAPMLGDQLNGLSGSISIQFGGGR